MENICDCFIYQWSHFVSFPTYGREISLFISWDNSACLENNTKWEAEGAEENE